MKDACAAILLVFAVVLILPVAVVIWKMAIQELFGSDRRKDLDRLIAERIAEIEKLAEDVK